MAGERLVIWCSCSRGVVDVAVRTGWPTPMSITLRYDGDVLPQRGEPCSRLKEGEKEFQGMPVKRGVAFGLMQYTETKKLRIDPELRAGSISQGLFSRSGGFFLSLS